MKKFLLSLFCLIAMAGTVGAETYKHTFSSGEFNKDGGTVILSDFEWTTTAVTYLGWDQNNVKGIQIGSKNSPNPSFKLSTSAFADCVIKSITVNSSIANSGDAKMTITVDNQKSEAYTLTTSDAAYTFDCEDTKGNIEINWEATQRAYYISSIAIEFTPAEGMVVVPTPEFITAPGVYADKVNIEAGVSADSGAIIYYTVDGTDPSYEDYHSEPRVGTTIRSGYYVLYHTLTSTANVKVMAVLDVDGEIYKSDIVEAKYIVSPTMPYIPASSIESGNAYSFLAKDSLPKYSYMKEYGYLPSEAATINENYIEAIKHCGYTFTTADGGYTIQDTEGRYLFLEDTYNSFNFSEKKPSANYIWTVSVDGNGDATIKNSNGKIVYYSSKYNNYACYDSPSSTDILPKLYMQREYPTATITPVAGSELEKIETITITCSEGIKPNNLKVTSDAYGINSTNFTISQTNANTLTLKAKKALTTTDNVEVKINITGDIMLNPNGMNMALPVTSKYGVRTLIKYNLVGNAPAAEVAEVNPANGSTVEKIGNIIFTFNKIVNGYDNSLQPMLCHDESGRKIPMSFNTRPKDENGNEITLKYEQVALVAEYDATINGAYTLEIPTGYFIDMNNKKVEGFTLKYTVVNDGTGIDKVLDSSIEKWVVYNITGVKVLETNNAANVTALPAGLYIVNGTKVIIK